MSKNILKAAKKYLEQGYSVIPVTERKIPAVPYWSKYQKAPMGLQEAENIFKDAKALAVLCGGSSRLFCLDADMKYDLTGDLWERFKNAVPKSILKKAYCQKTKNGGYHLVFIVPSTRLFGNQKFASRYTTADEKHQTYVDAYYNPNTKDKALKIASDDKSRILFESRSGKPESCGGYFLAPPSEGYEKVYGVFKEITEEEYDTLIEIARSFNEVLAEEHLLKDYDTSIQWELNPFDHYNRDSDIAELLISHGWSVLENTLIGRYWRFKRPGKTPTKDSAIFDSTTKIFNVFSTSTSFDVGRGYTPTGVFIHLECNGNEREAYQKIINLGYGIKK